MRESRHVQRMQGWYGRSIITFLVISFLLSGVFMDSRRANAQELSLDATTEVAKRPLDTEAIWLLDPKELNPHRKRWVIERKLDLKNLRAIPAPEGQSKHGVVVDSIAALTRIHMRSATGPWYRAMGEFPCSQEPKELYATRDGAEVAARAAATAWEELMKDRLIKLDFRLKKIRSLNPKEVILKAKWNYVQWLEETENEWRAHGLVKARKVEWRYYLSQADDQKICKDKRPAAPLTPWPMQMEPLAGEYNRPLLARAPAKRWDGLYSIRATIEIAGKRLNGKFLIDSGAAMSVLAPDWLQSQGVNPSLITLPHLRAQKINYAGGRGLARRATVDGMEVSGLEVPMTEFLLLNTKLFGSPNSVSECCDGILGMDFLRLFAVEFRAIKPFEVLFWPREGFTATKRAHWIEVHGSQSGGIISDCSLDSSVSIAGVRWDTGSDVAIGFHSPWKRAIKKAVPPWKLNCGGQLIAEAFSISSPASRDIREGSPFAQKYPGTTLGVDLLARSNFIFDLGHGRIWLSREGLNRPVPKNESGLEVKFVEVRDERILKVRKIRKNSPASKLEAAGLRVGSIITRIDSNDVEDLDLWEVEQKLIGQDGSSVVLEWKAKNSLKLAPLVVR